jgi:diguanylate cyclase (GGDEF)-like protein
VLGGILGLILGFGLAALIEYLQTPPEPGMLFNILDERTGLYNLQYFMLRLQQEMSRAKRKGGYLSLALLNLDHDGLINRGSHNLRAKAMRRVASILGSQLRDEDALATFDDSHLALLLPDAPEGAARNKIEKLLEKIHLSPLELDGTGNLFNLHMAAGLSVYRKEKTGEEMSPEELMVQAERALLDTKYAPYGKVLSFAEIKGDNNFHHSKDSIASEAPIRAPQMVMSNADEGD